MYRPYFWRVGKNIHKWFWNLPVYRTYIPLIVWDILILPRMLFSGQQDCSAYAVSMQAWGSALDSQTHLETQGEEQIHKVLL